MKFRMKVLCSLLTAAMCCTPVLSGCSSQEEPSLAQEEAEGKEQDVLDETDGAAGEGAGNLGKFSMEDINGSAYTEELFADHDLTMVNVFTTWCTPCIREIPDLEKLHKEMEGQGVGVVGIVLDAIGSSGKVDEKAVEKAKILAEKTGAAYPFLIPDEGYLGGRLAGIAAVPETFFVDKDGNIVGETYSGSRSFEDWKGIVEKELEGVAR
ncbi:TlpA disulfide reductase family protein [Lachnospiraceae bacterium 48-21]